MARRGYVQLANGFYTNDKVQELSRSGRMDAIGVFCMALTYCGDHLTDGFIPRRTMRFVIGATDEQLQALCDVEMLEEADEGWIIHDYAVHNRTKEQVLHARADANARKSKSRGHGDVTRMSRCDSGVTSGQTPEHQNTRTPKKEKEEYSSSFSKETGTDEFGLSGEKTRADADITAEYPNLDVSDAWGAFLVRHHGENRTIGDWLRQWKGWCQRRAAMSGVPPSKPHTHTWKCSHTLQTLGRSEETAQPDRLALETAGTLNKETR